MKTFNEWSQKEALGILPNYEHEPDSNLEGRVVNYYNDSRVRAGDSPNNEAADRYYQTSQTYRRAYDKARAGDSPADKEREYQSNRDAMIRSSKDLRNLVEDLQSILAQGNSGMDWKTAMEGITHNMQGIADELHRKSMGQD